MYNIFQKIISFAKREKRLCGAGVFVVIILLLNQLIFSSQEITPEDCLTNECGIQEAEKPQLSQSENIFYQDDILANNPSGYYRLTFQTKSDKQEDILVKLNTYTEKNEKIDDMKVEVSQKFKNHEVFFFLPEGYENIVFEKKNLNGDGNIFIKGVGIAKLNVDDPEEFALMQETIVGETTVSAEGVGQTKVSSDSFSLLEKPKTRLGQIFKAEVDYISGISFNMDIIRDSTVKDKDYKLLLQEVQCHESDCRLIGDSLASESFSVKDALEKYQKADGTFLFPLYANVEKGKKYFVGIDNSDVAVSWRNYLELKGGRSDDTYSEGSAGFRVKNNVYKIAGDLFFAVRGVNFDVRDGVRLLNGARIESLGKGEGKYTYVAKGEFVDILDLWSASPGTSFDAGRKVIVGNGQKEAALIYKVDTLHPIRKMHFFAQQTRTSWKKTKVEYSFDQELWIEGSFSEKNEQSDLPNTEEAQGDEINIESEASAEEILDATDTTKETSEKKVAQVFDFDIVPSNNEKTIYFRITPDPNDKSKSRYFSIKNLKITADLTIK